MKGYRQRIRSLQWIPATQLIPRDDNWGIHTAAQRKALRGAMTQLGVINAVIARELGDGRYEILDGHLRREELTDQMVPVLVVDLDDTEARLALASLDAIAGAREADHDALAKLLEGIEIDDGDLQELLRATANAPERADQPSQPLEVPDLTLPDGDDEQLPPAEPDLVVATSYALTVECRDADDQRQLYESLRADGRKVKVLTL